ncbi:MAG: hypothetical protein COX49_02145 [bacterium (Candidatus Stahlbacteria) CG23_combo_of_CG06-09_8_20_14_all_40_9]|nr:MAG: hypothetical protein COX49_02145 [bacterium (Candidatus Stahlbacteria) CG23_combo_of_CG06-09_8_20_14_all_40_9]
MFFGKDRKKNSTVSVKLDRSRTILVTGKRGSGKSYALGVLVEELFGSNGNPGILDNIILVVDPLGNHWTLAQQNPQVSSEWDVKPKALPVKVLVPGEPVERYGEDVYKEMKKRGVVFQRLQLNPSDISPSGWCDLFDLNISDPIGIVMFRAVQNYNKEKKKFTVKDLIDAVTEDERAMDRTKEALLNRLEMADAWDIFAHQYQKAWDQIDSKYINVLDLSVLEPGKSALANLALEVLLKDLFTKRIKDKRREFLGLSNRKEKVWLIIDEAQRFCPNDRQTLSKDILVSWVKEGRQPGLSAVFATQRPSALATDIITQADLILSLRLTNKTDTSALNKLSQSYLGADIEVYLFALKEPGQALMIDDEEEKLTIFRVRPRQTLHGGAE